MSYNPQQSIILISYMYSKSFALARGKQRFTIVVSDEVEMADSLHTCQTSVSIVLFCFSITTSWCFDLIGQPYFNTFLMFLVIFSSRFAECCLLLQQCRSKKPSMKSRQVRVLDVELYIKTYYLIIYLSSFC